MSIALTAVSEGGAEAQLVLPGAFAISAIVWSYSGEPTGGDLLVNDGTYDRLNVDITAAGPGFVPVPRGSLAAPAGSSLTITLAAPGGEVIGKISVL